MGHMRHTFTEDLWISSPRLITGRSGLWHGCELRNVHVISSA
jgi:hypothetical protein